VITKDHSAARVDLGRLDHKAHAAWRAQRKQALTTVSSSRWAGAITRAVEEPVPLGMRALSVHMADLRAAVEVLEQRCALRPQRTEDRCGHTTGQARTSTEPRWQARQFGTTAMHTMRTGPPENTRRQRPTPFGPRPSRTQSCSLMRNGVAMLSASMRGEGEREP
jgi:hypothetical protein